MNYRRNPLTESVRYALGAGVVAGLALAASPVQAQDDDNTAELDRVQVTGSRISRADIEGALPVTIIDREQIEFSGATSAADLIRNTTFNTNGSFRPRSGSSAQSFAGVDLRGLGENRTLVLIDGRRLPVSPIAGSGQDLNSIPIAAVERIEILSDGASAVYGSDAIGGVVNVVTRKDFTGIEAEWSTSNTDRTGGDTETGSLVIGMHGDRGRLMAGASFNKRDIVFQRDVPWTQTGSSTFSNNVYQANDIGGGNYTLGSLVGPLPGACAELGNGFYINPNNGSCAFDFTADAAYEAALDNTSLFARGDLEINDDWMAYMAGGVSRVESFGRYAPVPSSPWPGGAILLPVGSPNHPSTVDPVTFDANTPYLARHRFAALGNRDDTIDNNVYEINIGLQGTLGNWDLDVGVRETETDVNDVGQNYVVGGLAQGFIEDGSYNLFDPFSVTDDIAASMTSTIFRESTFNLREYYASAATDLFDMPAGPVGFAFGGEYREEAYDDQYDSLREGGQIVGSSGNSAGGSRDVTAVFAEMLFPLLDNLEMTIAARYDDYSDYGNDTSPKISFRYQPLDNLTLRASYGQGFRAPSLDILTQKPSFSADTVLDDATSDFLGTPRDEGDQIQGYQISNPNLSSETSDQFSVGVAWEPTDWLNGSLDYYNIEINDTIREFTAQEIVNCANGTAVSCPSGIAALPANQLPPVENLGLGVARGSQGQIVYMQRGAANLGVIETDGFDLNLRTNFLFGDAGRLANILQITWVNSYDVNGVNELGLAERPEWRGMLRNEYTIGDFSFAYNLNYIDSQSTSLAEPNQATSSGLDSWLTQDIQANWNAPWNGRVTLGVTNLTNEDPPIDYGQSRDYDQDLYDAWGRVGYLRYTQSF